MKKRLEKSTRMLIFLMLPFAISCNNGGIDNNKSNSSAVVDSAPGLINRSTLIDCGNGNTVNLVYQENGLLESYSLLSNGMNCESESVFFAEDGSIKQIIIGQTCQDDTDSSSLTFGTAVYSRELIVKSEKGKIQQIRSADSSLIIEHH